MSEDRELVERLAAIDATPRASWVAELRTELDAAWETGDAGYRDSLRTPTLPLVDHEPTPSEPSSGRRWLILVACAAAVVAAITLAATREDDATPADQPTPTVTVPPTSPPRALPDVGVNQVAPGTYFVDGVEGTPTPRIFVTVGAGWNRRDGGGAITRPELSDSGRLHDFASAIAFSLPGAVYSDACHWEDGYHSGRLNTLDGLVAALTEQGGWAEVTAPSDISINGYAGKVFQRTAPDDMSDCDTLAYGGPLLRPAMLSWLLEEGEFAEGTASGSGALYRPGDIETLLVLDVDGTFVVINTRQIPDASAAARAELATMLDSIRVERA